MVLVMIGLTAQSARPGHRRQLGLAGIGRGSEGHGLQSPYHGGTDQKWALTPLLRRPGTVAGIAGALRGGVGGDLERRITTPWLQQGSGVFLAGVSIASTPYREAIGSRLVSLRDFLLLFFFIDLERTSIFGRWPVQLLPALVFSIFVLIGNPLIVMGIPWV